MILMDQRRICEFKGRTVVTAHLMSDIPGEAGTAELDEFAAGIGMRRKWRQKTGSATEHYDLFGDRLDKAERAGAVVVEARDLVERVVRPKRAHRRALLAGLVPDPLGWSRDGRPERLVGLADSGLWWWSPESATYGVVDRSPRFVTEHEALTAALDWLDAGEPAIEVST